MATDDSHYYELVRLPMICIIANSGEEELKWQATFSIHFDITHAGDPYNRLRLWPSIKATLSQSFVFIGAADHFDPAIYLYLRKGGYVFGRVGLSVCLSVRRVTYKVANGFALNFRTREQLIKVWG